MTALGLPRDHHPGSAGHHRIGGREADKGDLAKRQRIPIHQSQPRELYFGFIRQQRVLYRDSGEGAARCAHT
ncbi:MAG: hypothetical protein MZV70_55805 [Desulfobacterales bacterium]|nr:hypothetical protein [Desulfobacterales bacterium]